MAEYFMDLHLFEGGAAGGAGAAPAAGGTGEGGEAAVTPGVLADGTEVDDRLAARLEEQARKRKARGEAAIQMPQMKQPEEAPAAEEQAEAEPSLDDEWTEAKKGKYREQYARDVQAAIRDRFKNQEDANGKLEALEPMLEVLRNRAGVQSNEELIAHVMDDDSLYEEEADEAGMTVAAYREFKQMQGELEKAKAKEAAEQENEMIRQHLMNLAQQGEQMKQIFPDFDLQKELQNETFRRLTAPGSGVDVRGAYYAVHHDELEPQAMAYGIQRAQQQISQTLQANRQRPMEGAMRTGQPAEISVDPRRMTREERQKYIERARRGETIVF